MSLGSRRELLNRVVARYRVSTWKEKGRILDEFVSGTGYDRKHAVKLLNRRIQSEAPPPRKRMPPRRYDEAVEVGQTTTELYPKYPSTYAALGEAFEQLQRFDQAIDMYSKFRELTARGAPEPSPPGHVRDAKTYWSWMRAVLQKDSAKTSVSPLDLARVSAELGEKDHAFALLNQAVQERAGELAFLRVSPSWDTIRGDARFQDLLRTVGLSGNLNHAR